jgi:hypothetical protein
MIRCVAGLLVLIEQVKSLKHRDIVFNMKIEHIAGQNL